MEGPGDHIFETKKRNVYTLEWLFFLPYIVNVNVNKMFRTLTAKKTIPVQRYLRKGLENAKGTRHLWRAPTYKLKEDEEWLNEWRVGKERKNEIFFDSAPTQEEIRNKIEEEEREEEERKEADAKWEQEQLEKENKKKTRTVELDAERKAIQDASNIMLQHYSGIQRIRIPRNYFIPGESWGDNKTHVTEKRPQIDNTGRGDYTRVRKSHIYVTILVPNDNDFTLSQLNRSEFERSDWELGFKVTEMPSDNYVSEEGGVVKSGLFTVIKSKGKHSDYRPKWYK